jgi:hypothetical protein
MITPSFSLTATERVLPRLALDFTTASLDPRVTFTRSGNTATRVNASGLVAAINANLPRFDYDPVTLACRGLLIEESRTNLLLQSQTFSGAVWSQSRVTQTPNATTAPDGTTTAPSITETAVVGNHVLQQLPSVTNGVTYTFSCYLKKGVLATAPDIIQLALGGTGFPPLPCVNFNLSTGAVTGQREGAVGSITSVGNGWWRCTLTRAAGGTGIGNLWIAFVNNNPSSTVLPSYLGSTTSDVFIWGAQLEAGAFATSYIPTAASQVTRTSDVATMTGTNFSDWYNAGAGGVVTRALPSTVSGINSVLQFDDGLNLAIIALRGNTTNPELYIKNVTDQAQIDAGTIVVNTAYNLGAAWNTDNCAAAVNGNDAVIDTSATIPTVTQARLGSDGTNYLNGHLQTVRYWPQRIINAEVQAFSK